MPPPGSGCIQCCPPCISFSRSDRFQGRGSTWGARSHANDFHHSHQSIFPKWCFSATVPSSSTEPPPHLSVFLCACDEFFSSYDQRLHLYIKRTVGMYRHRGRRQLADSGILLHGHLATHTDVLTCAHTSLLPQATCTSSSRRWTPRCRTSRSTLVSHSLSARR